MSISESKQRELAVLFAYMHHFGEIDPREQMGFLMETVRVTRKNVFDAFAHWQALAKQQEETEQLLSTVSQEYRLERLGLVERSILEVAGAELRQQPQQLKIVISDAIRLARKYASPEAGALVNALLDGLVRHGEGVQVDVAAIQESAQALEQVEAEAHAAAADRHPGAGSASEL